MLQANGISSVLRLSSLLALLLMNHKSQYISQRQVTEHQLEHRHCPLFGAMCWESTDSGSMVQLLYLTFASLILMQGHTNTGNQLTFSMLRRKRRRISTMRRVARHTVILPLWFTLSTEWKVLKSKVLELLWLRCLPRNWHSTSHMYVTKCARAWLLP